MSYKIATDLLAHDLGNGSTDRRHIINDKINLSTDPGKQRILVTTSGINLFANPEEN